ncbi:MULTISPECIES: hypothetical protein [Lactobacillales]|uniref:hypothetical protein n=1 Tax=Lactobacillales TaxID=186826 RepID=UPI00026C868B|nr:hypothetical protein [Carnobacterium maltaromaticum]
MKYRFKSKVVEAIQMKIDKNFSYTSEPKWFKALFMTGEIQTYNAGEKAIGTVRNYFGEEKMIMDGDYILKDEHGRIELCPKIIFETYCVVLEQ